MGLPLSRMCIRIQPEVGKGPKEFCSSAKQAVASGTQHSPPLLWPPPASQGAEKHHWHHSLHFSTSWTSSRKSWSGKLSKSPSVFKKICFPRVILQLLTSPCSIKLITSSSSPKLGFVLQFELNSGSAEQYVPKPEKMHILKHILNSVWNLCAKSSPCLHFPRQGDPRAQQRAVLVVWKRTERSRRHLRPGCSTEKS